MTIIVSTTGNIHKKYKQLISFYYLSKLQVIYI